MSDRDYFYTEVRLSGEVILYPNQTKFEEELEDLEGCGLDKERLDQFRSLLNNQVALLSIISDLDEQDFVQKEMLKEDDIRKVANLLAKAKLRRAGRKTNQKPNKTKSGINKHTGHAHNRNVTSNNIDAVGNIRKLNLDQNVDDFRF